MELISGEESAYGYRNLSVMPKECLDRTEFANYQEAYKVVTDHIDFYNFRQVHGSLHDLSPAEYREQEVNYVDLHKIYFKASITLEGKHQLISDYYKYMSKS